MNTTLEKVIQPPKEITLFGSTGEVLYKMIWLGDDDFSWINPYGLLTISALTVKNVKEKDYDNE